MQRFACLLLASLGLAATLPTQAEPIRLSEHQLAAVSGRAALPAADSATALPTGPGAGLDLLGLAGQPVTVLDRAAFLAALAQHGVNGLPAELYSGGEVLQLSLNGAPQSFRFDAGSLLGLPAGAPGSPSLGSIALNQLDSRGTVIWRWQR
jgi:hypothetical protein